MTRVSVIVPVYNVERFLATCLDSLVNQTLSDLEIIAVNDASPDNSIEVLREYESMYPRKVTVIDLPENRCLGGARNAGIEFARGEYLGFVDSDDFAAETMYEQLYSAASETNADIVDCDYYEYFEEDNRRVPRPSGMRDVCERGISDRRGALILNPGLFHTKIIRRELFFKHNIRFPERVFYEDLAISPMFALAACIERVEEPLYYYRANPDSITRARNSPGVFDRLKGAEIMLENAREWGLTESNPYEVAEFFVEEYYAKALAATLYTFDHPPIDRMAMMRDGVRRVSPQFRENPHYKRLPAAKRTIAWLNDVSPAVLAMIARAVTLVGLRRVARALGRQTRRAGRMRLAIHRGRSGAFRRRVVEEGLFGDTRD